MTTKLFFAGSGGQGILLMGQIVAKAAMHEGLEVTFLPSYGPEMRGGTANCTVVLSDSPISCPLIYEADAAVVMNLPSLIKFDSLVKPQGKLFVNTSLISAVSKRTDIELIDVPANETAISLGNERSANIVMLGDVLRHTEIIPLKAVEDVLRDVFSGIRAKHLPLNLKALSYYS